MASVTVLIFHRAESDDEHPLVRILAQVRERMAAHHEATFRRAGATGARRFSDWPAGTAFGEVLASLAPARGGLVVLSSGAVPLLTLADARRLVATASARDRRASTNNRYSSDICALTDAGVLRDLPPLPSDNALPRWLEEHAGFDVSELPGRDRLGVDLDTPLDIAVASRAPHCPAWLREMGRLAGLQIPRAAEITSLAADPHAELLVFGRAGSRTLAWLERHARCRVRFLAEERGMRASSPLAIARNASRPVERRSSPRASLGLLLDQSGPGGLADIVGELADGAVIDSRVLLAHRLGADESSWPGAADRFASDLLRYAEIRDTWLRDLTESAALSTRPILLGGHSLVGPGLRFLLR